VREEAYDQPRARSPSCSLSAPGVWGEVNAIFISGARNDLASRTAKPRPGRQDSHRADDPSQAPRDTEGTSPSADKKGERSEADSAAEFECAIASNE
jgi:hypothetical protein